MILRVVGSAILVVGGLVGVLSLPGSVCASGGCPDKPSGGGENMVATIKTVTTSCPVIDGKYVRNGHQLRLDSVATAQGQCQLTVPDCSQPGCPCVNDPINPIQERVIAQTKVTANIYPPPFNGQLYSIGAVGGKNPDGSTAFLHVLDSTQPNSSGPVKFTPYIPGRYLFHFQANIMTTACNILPDKTPQVDINVHVVTSFSRGERTSGSLDGGMNLPDPGVGYYQDPVGDTKNTDDWGAPSTIGLIQTVGSQWYQIRPTPRMGILDISRQLGGSFLPHKEHQNGLDIDVRYVRNDGKELPVDLLNPNQAPFYDRNKTIELLNLFAANASKYPLYRIIVDPAAGISTNDVPGVDIVIDDSPDRDHRHHFHVSLVDPDGPDENNCL